MVKKIILAIALVLILGVTWVDLLFIDAQIIVKKIPDVGVNPEKAVISAVIAALAGIAIFLWRQKDNIRKKYRN